MQPGQATISYQRKSRDVAAAGQGPDPEKCDQVMLLRPRKSRIYFLRRFFDYPITLSLDTIKKLGLLRMMKIGFSYLRAVLFPFRPEKNLEEFFINRFGRELYRTFFKSYTEKVWGERCSAISAEWGAQRVKGLSILGTLKHIFGKLFRRRGTSPRRTPRLRSSSSSSIPSTVRGRCGRPFPGKSSARGGRIVHHQRVSKIQVDGERIVAVEAVDPRNGQTTVYRGDWFFSTMPVKELVRAAGRRGPGRGAAGRARG